MAEPTSSRVAAEADLVFNIVWTGDSFTHLQVFTSSVLAHSSARFRFVANACPPDQIALLERFAEDHPGRVVEVLDVSSRRMIRHGDALDAVRAQRDDGPRFAFMDPDIFARRRFLPFFAEAIAANSVVTSGSEVWSTSNVRPEGHIGVNGEIVVDRDGFVFGCPHFAIYDRAVLDEVTDRWEVGFSSAGANDVSAAVLARLEELGRPYFVFDTGKIVNILIQGDGHRLVHLENPDLVHIGGVSHFLAPPMTPEGETPVWGENRPNWNEWDGMEARYAVARDTADVIRAALDGGSIPPLPSEISDEVRGQLESVRGDVWAMASRYRSDHDGDGDGDGSHGSKVSQLR
jgi:hypothetical protein